jgi:AraC-like DNA-binding protein
VALSPLLREVLRRVLPLGTLDRAIASERRLMDVMLDEFDFKPVAPLELPMPVDPRARRAAERMRESPYGDAARETLGRTAHASARTLERLFRAETGLSLGAWRQRARLMLAMSRLADGATVTAAGAAAGYASTSAFVAAFRRMTGETPGRYFRASDRAPESS